MEYKELTIQAFLYLEYLPSLNRNPSAKYEDSANHTCR